MKTLNGLLCVLALLVVSRPAAAHEDCPNCMRVRVALALAQANVPTVAKPTPTPEPTVTAPQPVRIYRIGPVVQPGTVVFPQYQISPAICTPGG